MKKKALAVVIFTAIFVFAVYVFWGRQDSQKNVLSSTNTTSVAATQNTALTMAEVQQHNSSQTCYLVINNSVYDVTSFIGQHPGGRQNIVSRCGTEVTGIFASTHSNHAWNLLARYKIGALAN